MIEQWSTDTQSEHIRSMVIEDLISGHLLLGFMHHHMCAQAELDAPSSLPNPDDEDDHLREEEDSVRSSDDTPHSPWTSHLIALLAGPIGCSPSR